MKAEDAPGDFSVDADCSGCGNCRVLAPQTFGQDGSRSFVRSQPSSEGARRQALQALLACPTAAIRSRDGGAESLLEDFPLPVAGDVYYCGFNSPKSDGAASYFIRDPAGNWLVNAPRYVRALADKIAAWGGAPYIFLTHRGASADADRYAERFGSRRIVHEEDLDAAPGAGLVLRGLETVELAPGFTAIPVPGRTRGSCVLLYKDEFLFSGEHLFGDLAASALAADRSRCAYDWGEQILSVERLLDRRFEWVLPSRGARLRLPPERARIELAALAARMKAS